MRMKTNLATLIVSALTVMAAGVFVVTAPAYAADAPNCSVLPQKFCDSSTAEVKGQANSSNSAIYMVLQWALAILTAGVGIVAVAAFVYAGIMYSSADSKPEQVKKAKDLITQTVIGLLAFAIMVLVLTWLIPGGIF